VRYNMDKIKRENVFRYSPSVYYTSLKESKDRRKYMKKMLDDWNIAKHKAYITDRFENLDITITGPHTESLTNGEKGTITSHLLNIYKWYHTTDERYGFFCEDDISFDTVDHWEFYWEDFMLSLPRDWKMVQLLRINPFNSMDYKEEHGLKIRKRNWCDWGCHYLISRRGAKELLEQTVIDEKTFHLEPQYNLHPMPENVLFCTFPDYLDTVYSVPLFVENQEFKTTFPDGESTEIDINTGAKLDQYESSVYYKKMWEDVGRNYSIDDIMNVHMPQYEYIVNRDRKEEQNPFDD
jgi:GR25 family glycosyltransferase involved in LPS biosynthesis